MIGTIIILNGKNIINLEIIVFNEYYICNDLQFFDYFMEENLDSNREEINNPEEPSKKSSQVEYSENNFSKDNNLKFNNQNTNKEVAIEINNKNVIDSSQKVLNKDENIDTTPKPVIKNINKLGEIDKSKPVNEAKIKPKKEIPIEKKPFNEFVEDHLLPSLIKELKERGFEVVNSNFKNTFRPIAGDKCWVIYCEIKDICNFWLSFEKDDISSSKSISLCKSNQKPSVIESFLIDEKRITLKLIISRILQRINGQKLFGGN